MAVRTNSPQGYQIQDDPVNVNPFWRNDAEGVVAVVEVSCTETSIEGGKRYTWTYEDSLGVEHEILVQDLPDEAGATFTPHVSSEGIISWTNDKGLENPEPVNIKGPVGATGAAATIAVGTVTAGEPGSNPVVTNVGTSGAAVFNFTIPRGQNGTNGQNGVTPNITANATVNNNTGSPSCTVVKSGTDAAPTFTFQFSGIKGAKGDTGATGASGAAATVTVGTVSTGAAGSAASVVNAGTSSAAVLNFTIPKGDTGQAGQAASIQVGTVTTGAAGTDAAVVNAGTSSAAVLNFTIPKGDKGETGEQGPQGIQGIQGIQGPAGTTPVISATASADATSSATPTVTVTKSGTDAAPSFAFAFSGLKGPQGEQGPQGPQGPAGAGSNVRVYSGLCTTAAATAVKAVTVQSDNTYGVTGNLPQEGDLLVCRFTNVNSAAMSGVKIKINNGTEYAVGTDYTTGTSPATPDYINSSCLFVFMGTKWKLVATSLWQYPIQGSSSEIVTGTETRQRTFSPKAVHDAITSLAGGGGSGIYIGVADPTATGAETTKTVIVSSDSTYGAYGSMTDGDVLIITNYAGVANTASSFDININGLGTQFTVVDNKTNFATAPEDLLPMGGLSIWVYNSYYGWVFVGSSLQVRADIGATSDITTGTDTTAKTWSAKSIHDAIANAISNIPTWTGGSY